MSNRPFVVTIVGALNIILGALVLIGAIALFVLGTQDVNSLFSGKELEDILKTLSDANLSWSTVMNIAAVLLLIPAIIDIVVGYGLLQGWKIMWWIGVIINGLCVIGALAALVMMAMSGMWGGLAANLIGLIINGVILWYLMRPNVKAFFGV